MIDDGYTDPDRSDKPYPRPALTPHPDIARLLKATSDLTQAQHDTQRIYRNLAANFATGQRMALVLAFAILAYVPAMMAATFLPLPGFVRPVLWLAALACIVATIVVGLRLRRARLAQAALFASLPADGEPGQPSQPSQPGQPEGGA